MIKQLVIFTYAERLRDPFIKTLHTIHGLKLKFSNKIEDL
jgi:hypothetical protein